VVGIAFSSYCYPQETVIIDDFSSYKDTTQFLSSWNSRVDGYKQTLKDNSYYYYLRPDPLSKDKKYLCSSLRMFPKDFVRTDVKPEDIKMILGDGYIKSVSLYKDYWLKKIRIGDLHERGKEVFMEWDWMANKLPEGALEVKEKDDHAIAVYAVIYIGWMRFRVIKYVWSSTDGTGIIPSEIVKDENPDLILLDITMPVMDGITMAKKLRETNTRVPIIFLTNMSDLKNVSEAMESAPDYIVKSDVSAKDVVVRVKEKLHIK